MFGVIHVNFQDFTRFFSLCISDKRTRLQIIQAKLENTFPLKTAYQMCQVIGIYEVCMMSSMRSSYYVCGDVKILRSLLSSS